MARRQRSIVGWLAAASAGALVLALAAALLFAPAVAEFLLKRALAGRGLAPVELTVRDIGRSGATLEALRLGAAGEFAVERVRVDYHPASLWHGRLDRVVVEGLRIRGRVGDNGLSFGALDRLAGGAAGPGDGADLRLPVDKAVLRDAELLLDTPEGPIRVGFGGELASREGGGSRFAGPYELDHAQVQASGEIMLAALSGDMRGALTIDGGAFARGGSRARIEAGRIELAKPAQGPPWLDAMLSLAAAELAGAALDSARLTITGALHPAEGGFGFAPEDCIGLETSEVRAGDLRMSPGPLRLCPRADGGPLLSLSEDSGAIRLAGTLRPTTLAVTSAASGGAARRFEADLGATDLDGNLEMDGLAWRATAKGADSSLTAPDFELAARQLAVDAWASGTAATVEQASATLRAAVHDLRDAPVFAPLHLAGEATLAAGEVRFNGVVAGPSGTALFDVEGRHALATGQGQAWVAGRALAFTPGGLQPQALLPVLRGKLASVAGRLGLAADFRWRSGALSSWLDLTVTDGAAQTPFAALAGIDGKVAFDSLLPPSTPPNQSLRIGLLNPGLPLRDGRVTFTLRPDGRLHLAAARWPFAGGEIALEQADIVLGAGRQSVVLQARNIEVAELLGLFRLEGVFATGRVSGAIPVRVEHGTAVIEQGRLATDGGGIIRYTGGAGTALAEAGGKMQLLLQALENFHYEELAVGISGEATGTLDIALHISGANPELYGGHPFELNFALGGELAAMLRQGLVGYRIPDSIRRQLQGAE